MKAHPFLLYGVAVEKVLACCHSSGASITEDDANEDIVVTCKAIRMSTLSHGAPATMLQKRVSCHLVETKTVKTGVQARCSCSKSCRVFRHSWAMVKPRGLRMFQEADYPGWS